MNPLKPLTVSVAQPLSVVGELAANAVAHAELVSASNTRLVVFPELSLSAYDCAVAPIALDAPELQPLQEAAIAGDCVVLSGAPVKINQNSYIAFVRIDAMGVSVVYLKTCLTPDEQRVFRAGNGPSVTEVDGWRIGLAICKDTWNVAYMKNYQHFDLDLIVAGVFDEPEEELSAYEIRARMARQLQVPMAFARTAGYDSAFHRGSGKSVIYDHTGEIVAQTTAGPGKFARARLIPRR